MKEEMCTKSEWGHRAEHTEYLTMTMTMTTLIEDVSDKRQASGHGHE